MARTLLMPLGSDSLAFPVGEPEFSALAATILGDDLTAADGWDAAINNLADAQSGEEAALLDLDPELSAASFVLGEFEGANISPVLTEVGEQTASGTAQMDTLGGSVTPPATGPGAGAGTSGGGTTPGASTPAGGSVPVIHHFPVTPPPSGPGEGKLNAPPE